jgi:ATP-binding cassette subfamily F protein uup
MNYLSVEDLTKSFGERLLFEGLTFGIDQGQKVAIVAKNGNGKTTLLRCLLGKEPIDSGRIVFRKDIRIAYMQQAEDLPEDLTIWDAIFTGEQPELSLVRQYNEAINAQNDDEMNRLSGLMTDSGAWDLEVKINQILSVLKLNQPQLRIGQLSGGQKKRVALAQVLVSDADFMILDEPTNHLDLDMIEWLENHLSQSRSTLLMVTHDRYFLEVVCDTILELADRQLYKYKGNFSYYLEKKAERQEQLEATIDKARNNFRKELEWMRRQPKARGTKQKARIDSFHDLKKVATQRVDQDEIDIPVKMERLGTKIVELHRLGKAFKETQILNDFSYHFQRQERLGIVGNNGTGKTTFLRLIQQLIEPDKGKVVVGETVRFGYYSQDLIQVSEDKKVIDVIRDIAEFIPLEKGRQMSAAQFLERFLFDRSMHYQFVHKLSGGEKRRLKLMTILMSNPNFLILDEPTNDLDIFVMGVLEEYLRSFQGCLIVVSHDRYFMDKMVDHLFVFEGEGEIKDIVGNYTQFREQQQQIQRDKKGGKNKDVKVTHPEIKEETPKRKLSFREKEEFQSLEKEIESLEEQKKTLTEKLSSGAMDGGDLQLAGKELASVVADLENKTDRWLELSELV